MTDTTKSCSQMSRVTSFARRLIKPSNCLKSVKSVALKTDNPPPFSPRPPFVTNDQTSPTFPEDHVTRFVNVSPKNWGGFTPASGLSEKKHVAIPKLGSNTFTKSFIFKVDSFLDGRKKPHVS